MSSTQQLRNLPAVDEILRHQQLAHITERYARPQIVTWIRNAVDECRHKLLQGQSLDKDAAAAFVIERTLAHAQAESGCRLQAVVNATGILLHTNLGRAPLAEQAVQRMQQVSGYANVELNLQSGKRNQRAERVCRLLSQLTAAEDAIVVNNCAAATMLVLQTMAAGREIIVSRGQLVEIGGGFRLPEVFAASGAKLKEVGTTNRTYCRDYETAITENTAAIIRVHRSNFYQTGFVTEPDIVDLVALGKDRSVPVIDDVGSGCVHDLTAFGLQEPSVSASVAAGADLTLFSGDKLFGGPQAGIVVGRSKWISQIRTNPMMRALRIDKVTLAALEATTEIHLSGNALTQIPLLQMLSRTPQDVRQACEDLARHIRSVSLPAANAAPAVDVVECTSQVGGGSVPGSQIQSFGIRISGINSDLLAQQIRTGTPAVLGRIQDDALLLDLRTVDPSQYQVLATALTTALRSVCGSQHSADDESQGDG